MYVLCDLYAAFCNKGLSPCSLPSQISHIKLDVPRITFMFLPFAKHSVHVNYGGVNIKTTRFLH